MKKGLFCKGLVLGVILLFVGASVVTSMGVNVVEKQDLQDTKTFFEDYNSNGNILYVGGEGPNNYTKIQDAINNAIDGDTVFVYNDSSPYYENIIVDKAINLVGEERDTTIIIGLYEAVSLNGLAYNPITDKLYGASSYSFYEIDKNSGNQTYIGDFKTGGIMIGISFDNFGNCYGVNIGTDSLYSIDIVTGEASLIGSFGINLNYAQDCAYDRDNDIFYLSAYNIGDKDKGVVDEKISGESRGYGGELYICDTETANLTLVGAFENGAEVDGFAIPYEQEKTLEKRFVINRLRKEVNFSDSRYELFYGYCAYDPIGQMDDYTISFFSDHPENLMTIAYTQSNNFISGADWVNDTWYGVEYGTGQLYTINPDTGEMDAIGYSDDVVRVTTDWVNISNFTIKPIIESYSNAGISICSNFNTITENNILDNKYGIEIDCSSNNIINGNIVSSNWKYGIWLSDSMNNTIIGNTISNSHSTENIGIYLSSSNNNNIIGNCLLLNGLFVENSYDNKVENNTVNGKPLVYFEDESDKVIDNAGQIILVNCDNITAENLVLSNTYVGIELWGTNNSKIRDNEYSTNWIGIYLFNSNGSNNITSNNIINNNKGIEFDYSSNNSITSNTISSNEDYGIIFLDSMNNTIASNNFTDIYWSFSGIYFHKSKGNIIANNNFTNIEYYDWFSGWGIYFDNSSSNIISRNNISNNFKLGIYLIDSSDNILNGNIISKNYEGLSLVSSNNNNIFDNAFFNDGLFVQYSYQNIISNNTVNNKPLIYMEKLSNIFLNEDAGQIILVECTNITILNQNLSNTTVGILLWSTKNCHILGNNISNNKFGITSYFSYGNKIIDNNIIKNRFESGSEGLGVGLYFDKSSNNTISSNNLSWNWDCIQIYESINYTFMCNNITHNKDGMYIYECSDITIIDNNITYNGHDWWFSGGIYFVKSCDNIVIDNNISYNWKYGITLSSSSNNTIAENTINENCLLSSPYCGIMCLEHSNSNNIIGNIISNNRWGIGLSSTSDNNILNNSLLNNGLYVEYSYHNNIENNTVNDKPLVYLEDKTDYIIIDAGQIILINCNNVTAENQNLSNTTNGIELWETNNSKILNNNCSNNDYGILILFSSNNTIKENIILNTKESIKIIYSSGNNIIGNTILNNIYGIFLWGFSNLNNIIYNNISTTLGDGIELYSSCFNTINGNTIKTNINYGNGIYIIVGSNGNTIKYNIILNSYNGIYLKMSANSNNIMHNIISYNDYGINFWFSSSNTILQNNISYNDCGMYLSSSNSNTIRDNNITNNNLTILFNPSESFNNNIIIGNNISNNKCGMSVGGTNNIFSGNILLNNRGENGVSGSNNIVSGNTFSHNLGGIYIGGYNNIISGNNISNNIRGIYVLYYTQNNNITNNTISKNDDDGIRIDNSGNNSIFCNIIISNNGSGICLHKSNSSIIIGNNIVLNNGYGIDLEGSSNTITDNNIISNNKTGIFLWGSSNIILDNNISNNWNGIILEYSSGNNIIDNNINSNNYDGIDLYESSGNNITDNNIINNNYGIIISSVFWPPVSSCNNITGNNITNNNNGMYLSYSNSNNITRNSISKNIQGIYIESSTNNIILKNNFLRNLQHAFFINCTNIWNQNYWNRPRILPKLIFGTIEINSKQIPWINIDWRPAFKPYDIPSFL